MPSDKLAPLALPPGNLFLSRDIRLRQIQVFHAIVVCGSITKAADFLCLSQPSVSQQLTRFEQELDAGDALALPYPKDHVVAGALSG